MKSTAVTAQSIVIYDLPYRENILCISAMPSWK
jgi:hypothetical protein